MDKRQSDNGSTVAVIVIVIAAIIFFGGIISSAGSSNNKTSTPTKTTPTTYTTQKKQEYEAPKTVKVPEEPETWTCVDATSYDRNSNNDNYCTSSKGKSGYYSDCQAVSLDPDYSPSQRGASYYNGCAR